MNANKICIQYIFQTKEGFVIRKYYVWIIDYSGIRIIG